MAWTDAARAASAATRKAHAKGRRMATVWHGTSIANALKIQKQGFRPLRVGRRFEPNAYANFNATYFAYRKATAVRFAYRPNVRKNGYGAVIEVHLPRSKLHIDKLMGVPEWGRSYWARGVSAKRIISVRKISRAMANRAWGKGR